MIKLGEYEFNSLSAACSHFKISIPTVNKKLEEGYTLEEIFGLKEPLIVNGKRFSSKAEACRHYGVSYGYVSMLVRNHGITFEEAVNCLSYKKGDGRYRETAINSKKVTIDGVEYNSLEEACSLNGVTKSHVNYWMKKKGISFEEAVKYSSEIKNAKFVVNGIEFDSKSDVCKYYELSNGRINEIMRRHNVDLETAVNSVLENRKNKENCSVVYKGVTYESITKLASENGILVSTVRNRMNKGYSLEEALNKDLFKISVGGLLFDSIKQACEYYGVPYSKVHYRMKHKGYSLDEAFALPEDLADTRNKYIKVDDVSFKSMNDACKYFNVNYLTVQDYSRRNKIPFEEAIICCSLGTIIVNGLRFKTKGLACKHFGVCQVSVSKLMRNHKIDFENAINQLVEKKQNTDTETIVVNGVKYKGLASICSDKGFNYQEMKRFLEELGISDKKPVSVFMHVVVNVDEDTSTFIGTYKSISEFTECSEPTVSKVIKKLQEKKLLNRVQKGVWLVDLEFLLKIKSGV